MTNEQKAELIERIENEYGIYRLFQELGLKQVKQSGKYVSCVCPMHSGADNPTGFVYEKECGYCFTQCNRGWDLFHIVQKVKNIEFPEALQYISSLVGIDASIYNTLPSPESVENRSLLMQFKKIKKQRVIHSWEPLNRSLFDNIIPCLHSTLRKEGFDEKTRDYFDLGFAPDGYLENRITIPIEYIDDSLVTVSGRSILPDDVLKENHIPRYLNWYDTEKGVTLYNINRALPHIEITNEIIIVEGYKSVWRLHQWGIDNTVAGMGSSLTEEQQKILIKLGCKLYICGDRDKAGFELNNKVINLLSKFSEVIKLDMYKLPIPEHSSVDNITNDQFMFLINSQ